LTPSSDQISSPSPDEDNNITAEPKQARWSWRKRLLIYCGAFCVAVTIALIAVGIWFFQTISHIQAMARFEMEEKVCESNDPNALKILFVGNSLTYVKSLPRQFAYLCQKSGQPLKLYQVVEPSQTLAGHLTSGRVLRLLQTSAPWDYVIIQERSSAPYNDREAMEKSGKILADMARKFGAKPVLLMTWADRGDLRTQRIISQVYKKMGRELNVTVVPDGDLWFTARRQYPALDLYDADGHHPGPRGSFLGALLLFKMLADGDIEKAPAIIPSGSQEYGQLCVLTDADRTACIKLVQIYTGREK
jgi:hypothetical protein